MITASDQQIRDVDRCAFSHANVLPPAQHGSSSGSNQGYTMIINIRPNHRQQLSAFLTTSLCTSHTEEAMNRNDISRALWPFPPELFCPCSCSQPRRRRRVSRRRRMLQPTHGEHDDERSRHHSRYVETPRAWRALPCALRGHAACARDQATCEGRGRSSCRLTA